MIPSGQVRRALLSSRAFAVGAAAVLCSCQTGTDADSGPRPVVLAVTVADSADRPAPGAMVFTVVWPYPALPAPAVDSAERTDTAGRMRIPLGWFPDARVDSVALLVQIRGCSPGSQYVVHLPQGALLRGSGDTLLARVVVARVPPPATTVAGDYCAFGRHPQWGPFAEYQVSLRVESVTGNLFQGRWRIDHSASYGTDQGTFTGTVTGELVVLALVNEVPQSSCAGQLMGAIAANGTWGPLAFSAPAACEGAPDRLDFAVDSIGDVWP